MHQKLSKYGMGAVPSPLFFEIMKLGILLCTIAASATTGECPSAPTSIPRWKESLPWPISVWKTVSLIDQIVWSAPTETEVVGSELFYERRNPPPGDAPYEARKFCHRIFTSKPDGSTKNT
jgi:hypothetical protein